MYVSKSGKVVGKILPLHNKLHFANETIRGVCNGKKLKLYFFTNFPKQICGVMSHGKVIDKNNIDLDLRWESAMTGGMGKFSLYHLSNHYDHSLLHQLSDFDFAKTKVGTCH